MKASDEGHLKIVKVLLDKGAEVNVKNKGGWTALMWATIEEHKKIIRLLKKAGAR
jgi:ankyrin repeat protein